MKKVFYFRRAQIIALGIFMLLFAGCEKMVFSNKDLLTSSSWGKFADCYGDYQDVPTGNPRI